MTDEHEWHEWRSRGLGASDIAGILGISPWASPWSVWADKAGLLLPREPSEIMEFGKRAEAMIGPWFHDRTGLYVVGEQTWCSHPEHTWARATVDAFIAETDTPSPDELVGVGEWKTEGATRDWETVPAHYQCQAQWAMFVTGLPRTWFAVLHGRRFRVYELERDDEDIAFMFQRAEEFWINHVLTGEPPPVDGSEATSAALAEVYGEATDAAVEVEDWLPGALVEAKAHLKAAEADVDRLSNALRAAMGEATTATVGGQRVATWKPQERKGVDVKRLEADHPALVEKYRTTSQFRVLRLSKETRP